MTLNPRWTNSRINCLVKRYSSYVEVFELQIYTFLSYNTNIYLILVQCDKLREQMASVRELLAKKDDSDPEEIRKATGNLQQSSLKLFEMAYKKVRFPITIMSSQFKAIVCTSSIFVFCFSHSFLADGCGEGR